MADPCPSGWSATELGHVVHLQRGHDLPSSQRTAGSVPVIGSGGLAGWHDEAKAEAPGVVIGRAANLGRPNFVTADYWPLNTTLYVTNFFGNDPRFVFYMFQALDLTAYDSGSVQPMLNRNYVAQVPVCLPPPWEQRAIARVLGTLEDKIDANTRLVAPLSELAQSLLSRAVQTGLTYRVADVAEVRKGLSYKGSGLADAGMPMVNLANAENFGWLKRSGFKHYTAAYKPRHIAEGGSLLVSGVEQTWRHEIIGWPMLLPEDVGTALFSHHVLLVDFAPGWSWLKLPLWAHLYSPAARARIEGMVYGTTVATMPAEALTAMEFGAPSRDDPVLDAAADLLRRAWAAERESAALAALRDALLPPLMSGELRVRNVEAVVEQTV